MRPRDVCELVLLGAIWGAAFPMARVAAPVFGPAALTAVRVAVGAALLALLLRELGDVRRHAGRLLVLGLINTAIPFTLFAYAVLSISAGLGSLLNATTPIFTAILAYLVFGERMSALRALGVALAFAGIGVLVWDGIGTFGARALLGIAAGLLGAALYAVAAIYTKRSLAGVAPSTLALGGVLSAAIAMAPLGAVNWPASPPPVEAWLAAAALGALCTAIAYVMYFRLLRNVGPARSVSVTFLIPVFGILWGALFLDEPITIRLLIGCAIVLCGTGLALGLLDRARTPSSKKR